MEGDSLRRQTDLASDYARRHGLELDDELTFKDLGLSAFRGANANVGKLGEFLEAVRVGQVPQGSYLLVESLDRISRDFAFDAQSLLSDMVRNGIVVVTLMDERVYSLDGLRQDPMGMMYSIMGFMRANEESAVKSRRLKAAWHAKRATAHARPLTSRVPAWLKLDPATNRIIALPERTAIVQRIFDMTLNGVGQHKIASTFNREGIAPWGDGTRPPGKQWYRSYIFKILNNPAVIGTMTPHVYEHVGQKAQRVPLEPMLGYYPAVISPETWAESQALMANKGAARGRQAAAPISSILARLAACPKCDRTMLRVQKGRRSQPHLVCSAAKSGAGCEYKSVRYSAVEQRLLQVLPAIIRDREGLAEVEGVEERITELVDLVFACQTQIEELADLITETRSPALTERLAKLERELPAMQAELQLHRDHREIMMGPVVGSRIERAIAAMTPPEGVEPDRAEINLALRKLFKRAVINWPAGTVDLEWQLGGVCRVHYAWTGGAWSPSTEEALSGD